MVENPPAGNKLPNLHLIARHETRAGHTAEFFAVGR